MGCPAECEIGDDLTFSVCTHHPETGILTDADNPPSYRVYENEDDPPIATGQMAKLDDDDTTGFYVETITISAPTYENGKTYTIYISAEVDTNLGGLPYAFKAYDKRKADIVSISGSSAAADNLEASAETIVPAAAVAGTLSTTQMSTNLTEDTNDHYNGRIIIWTDGNLKWQATDITGYDGASKVLTFTAVTEAPQDGDGFIIV